MFEVGFLVKVEGLSQKGKNRINEHGAVWKVKKVWTRKLLLKSTDGKDNWRWVDGAEDSDFMIVDVLPFPEDN